MATILTFLGKGGIGKTTAALATAGQFLKAGSKVLLVGQDPTPTWAYQVGCTSSGEVQTIATGLDVVQIQPERLLEKAWEELKKLENQYLQKPFLQNVYGQELAILPGMEEALAFNLIREYLQSKKYDVIIYDGYGNLSTLRAIGTPENISWYGRRFPQVLGESEVVKTIAPFIPTISAALLNVSWNIENFGGAPLAQAREVLEQAKKFIQEQTIAYVVTTGEKESISTAKYLWGSAQQINLRVGGVIVNRAKITEAITAEFQPLPLINPDEDNLANLAKAGNIPQPLVIDIPNRQIKVFLPGFEKKQVKLSQYGAEITIEAGSQRRNILLPPTLQGQTVKGAKFQEGYLILSL